MKIKYVGRYDGVRVPDLDDAWVANGQDIEVEDEELAKRFLEQKDNWEKVGAPKEKPAAPAAEEK